MAEPAPNNDLQAEERAYGSTLSQPGTSGYRLDEDINEILNNHGSPTAHTAFNVAEELTPWYGHKQRSQSGMYLDQPLLYTPPGTSSLVDMSCRAATASSFDPSSSSILIPQPIHHTIWTSAATNNGEPSCNSDTHASELRSLQDPSADDVIYIGQRSRKRRAVAEAIDTDDTAMRIGSVLSNRKFACDDEDCAGQTFARLAELRRHHITHHAVDKPNFWCHVPTCPRSVSGGGEAFHRRDKLVAHVKSMHS